MIGDTEQHVHSIDTGAAIVTAAKVSPPVAASTWLLLGHPLEHYVVAATLAYTVLLIIHQLYKMYHDMRGTRNGRRNKR